MGATGNPLFDNPNLKAGLAAAMQQQQAPPPGAVMPPAGAAPPPQIQMPNAPPPQLPADTSRKPMVFGPVGQVAPGTMAPKGTLEGDKEAREQSMVAGPGINSIAKRIEGTQFGQHHPLLGKIAGLGLQIPATIGDIALESASPIARLALSHVPGTYAHQAATLKGENQAITADEANTEKEAQTGAQEAEIPLRKAQTEEATARGHEAEARAGALENPQEKLGPESVHVLPDGKVISVTRDPKTGKPSAEVVYEGTPGVKTEVKQLEVNGKPHQVLINSQTGAQIKDLGETGEKPPKPPVVNVNQGVAALDRESARFAKTYDKGVNDAGAQLEKIADARAMINGNAESQALGIPKVLTALVSGQGSGVRITQPELNMIAKARGIQGDFEGWINKVSGKGQLTKTQQQQLSQILDDVRARLTEKQAIANGALDRINGANSREEIIQADKETRQKLADFEKTGHYVGQTVQLKNGKSVTIKAIHPDGSFD